MTNRYKLVLLLLFLSGPISAQKFVRIEGRVIHNKAPMPEVEVLILDSCRNCPDIAIPSTTTNNDGSFSMGGEFSLSNDARIFIVENTSECYWNPFYPVSFLLPKLRQYRGIKLKLSRSGAINLRDVAPTVRFKEVEIDLSKAFDSDAFLSSISYDFKLTIYSRAKMIDNDISIPKRALFKQFLKLALPIGAKWNLRLSYFNGQKTMSTNVFVDLIKSADKL
jgi:hypothetical protein